MNETRKTKMCEDNNQKKHLESFKACERISLALTSIQVKYLGFFWDKKTVVGLVTDLSQP